MSLRVRLRVRRVPEKRPAPEEMSSSYSMLILGLDPANEPSRAECRDRMHKLARILHPDRKRYKKKGALPPLLCGDDIDDAERIRLVNRAITVIEADPATADPDPAAFEAENARQHEAALAAIAEGMPAALFSRAHVERMVRESPRLTRQIPLRISREIEIPPDNKRGALSVMVTCSVACVPCSGVGVIVPKAEAFEPCAECKGTTIRPYYVALDTIKWVHDLVGSPHEAVAYAEAEKRLAQNPVVARFREFPPFDLEFLHKFCTDTTTPVGADVPAEQYIMSLDGCDACLGVGVKVDLSDSLCRWCKGQGLHMKDFSFEVRNPEGERERTQRTGVPYIREIDPAGPLGGHVSAIAVVFK